MPDVDQEEIRLAATALLAPGYLPSMIDQTLNTSSFNVRQDTGTNLQLKIGSGTSKKDGYVILGTVAGQGAYIVRLDATTKTITVPAADATNPARYGVYLFIDDTAYSGTPSRAYAQVSCIRGTPAGSPTTPGPLATYSAYVLLWEFQLAANATAVTNTILDAGTDQRRKSVPATSGIIVNKSSTSNQTGITAVADITFATATWIAVSGHQYRVTLSAVPAQLTSPGEQSVTIQTGASGAGTVLAASGGTVSTSSSGASTLVTYTTGSGSTSVHARASVTAGSITILNATSKGWFTVEDLGPI